MSVVQPSPFLYRFSCIVVSIFGAIFNRLRVYGVENIPATGGCVIAANHCSFLDPPFIASRIHHRMVHFMARDSLFHSKLGNWYLRSVGVLPLAREKADVGALRLGVRLLKKGDCVVLFPEGTRSPDGELQTPKGGIGFLIAKGAVPVIPAYIQGTFDAFPKGAKCPKPGKVTLHFGEPILPEDILELAKGEDGYNDVSRRVMQEIKTIKDATSL